MSSSDPIQKNWSQNKIACSARYVWSENSSCQTSLVWPIWFSIWSWKLVLCITQCVIFFLSRSCLVAFGQIPFSRKLGQQCLFLGLMKFFPLAGILHIEHYIIFLFTLGSSEITSVEAPKPYLRHNFERLYCDNYTSDLFLIRLL